MEINKYLDVFNVDLIEKNNDDSTINEESKITDLNRQQFSINELVAKLRLESVLPGHIRKSLLLIGENNSKKKIVYNLLSRRTKFPGNINNESDLNQSTCKSVSIGIRSNMAISIIYHDESGNLSDRIVSTICLQYVARGLSSKVLLIIDADKITYLALSDILCKTSLVVNAYGDLALLFFSENEAVDYLNIIDLLSSLNNIDPCRENIQVVEFINIMKRTLNKYQNKIIIHLISLNNKNIARQRVKNLVTVLEDFPEVELNPNFTVNLPEQMLSLIKDGCEKLVTNYQWEIDQENFITCKNNLDCLNTIQKTISEININEYKTQSLKIVRRKLETLDEEANVIFKNLCNLSIDDVDGLANQMAVCLSKLYGSQVLNDYNDISCNAFHHILQGIDSQIEKLATQIMQKDEMFPEDIISLVRLKVMERIRAPYLPTTATTTEVHKVSPVVAKLSQRLQYRDANMNSQLKEIWSSVDSKDPMMTITSVNSLDENWKYKLKCQSIEVMFAEWIQLLNILTLIEKYNSPVSLINLTTSSSNRVEQLISLFLYIQTTLLEDRLGLLHKVRVYTASDSDRKLLFSLIDFLRLATNHLVCDYFPYYHLHSIYNNVVKALSHIILQLLSSIDQHLLHYDFSKMAFALQFLSELRTGDDELHCVLTETLGRKVELINERLKGILANIRTCYNSKEIPDYQSIVQNYASLVDALSLEDIIVTDRLGTSKIMVLYVIEAQGLLNNYWKDSLQSTLQDIETFSFERLKVDINQLDAMSVLTAVLPDCAVDIERVVSVMDKKLRMLEFIDSSIFIPLQYDKINDFFRDLSNWLSLFQSFQEKPLFTNTTNQNNWVETKLKSLSRLHNNIIQDIKHRIDFLKENVSRGFIQFSCEPIKQSLDELQNMKVLEGSLSSSDVSIGDQYEGLKGSIKDELERLVKEADCLYERGEINRYNEMKLFLARTVLFAQHITGCDVCSFAQQLSGKHHDPLYRLARDVSALLRDQRYSDIMTKLDASPYGNKEESSKSAYRQVVREISKHIRQLIIEAKEIQSWSADGHAIAKLGQLFQICCKVNILKPFAENEVNDLVNQTVVSCKVTFQKFKTLMMAKMAQYDFSMETAAFYDMFCQMKSLDVYLQQIHSQYGTDVHEAAYLLDQFERFLVITIRPLSKYLLEQARRYMGVYMVDSSNSSSSSSSNKASRLETDSEDVASQDPPPAADHSIVRNIDPTHFEEGKLRALLRGAMGAVHCRSQFHDTVDFPSLVDHLGSLLNTGCSILRAAVEETMELKDFDRALSLLDHLRRCVALYQENYQHLTESANIQQQSYELLMHTYERAKGTYEFEKFSYFGGKEEVDASIKKLISLREARPDAYRDICFSLYRVLGIEKAEFDALCLVETHPMAAGELGRIFAFMLALLSYENQIGFHGEHFDRNMLCSRCSQAFQAFLDSACGICHSKVETNEDVEDIMEELNEMTLGILQLLKQCKDRGMRRWLENSYYDLNKLKAKALDKISRLREVEKECLHFEIMEPQDMLGCVSKLQVLSRQASLHSGVQHSGGDNGHDAQKKHDGRFETIISGIVEQIGIFHTSLHYLYSSNQYNKIATALRNITALNQVSQLNEQCDHEQTFIIENIQSFRSQLEDSFRKNWKEFKFEEINQTLSKIRLLDEAFLDNQLKPFPPLFEAVEQTFLKFLSSKLSAAYDMSSSVEDQADAIYQFKEFLLNIDDPCIHNLGDILLEKLFENLSERNVSFYRLGLLLVGLGTLGEHAVQTYRPFKAVSVTLYNRQVSQSQRSLDVTLSQLRDASHNHLPSFRIDSLKSLVRRYNDHLESCFSVCLPTYSATSNEESTTSLPTLIDRIVANARILIPPFRSLDIIDLLAEIFAVYSIHTCRDAWEVSRDKSCVFRLTNLQILSICRLLALDEQSGLLERITSLFGHRKHSLNGHLLQMEKCGGKSVILGGLACLLAVVGYRVYCLSSSQRLSIKDREPFEDLFQLFGVRDRVVYTTQEGIAEKVINSQCSVSDVLKSRLLRQAEQEQDVPSHPVESLADPPSLGTVCLLSEGVVLLEADFYTGIYSLVSSVPCDSVRRILDYIWRHRSMSSKLDLERIRSLPEYASLRAMFHPEAEELVKQQVQCMLNDVQQYNNPPYLLVDTPAGKMIGYKLHDEVSTSVTYRYRTAFATLCESSKHSMADKEEMYALQIPCGEWSYSEVIRHFECVLGVTSHFESLTAAEREVIRREYKIDNCTVITLPADCASEFRPGAVDVEVICTHSCEEHFRQIFDSIMVEHTHRHPVIAVFPSEPDLSGFLQSDFGRQLPDYHKITESTKYFSYYANRCEQSGTISLTVEGLVCDLNNYLPVVPCGKDTSGDTGLALIQTYFADHPIKDSDFRTLVTSQSQRGTHKLILRADALTAKYGLDVGAMEAWNQAGELLPMLGQRREQTLIESKEDRTSKVAQARGLHDISMRLLARLGGAGADTTGIVEVVLQLAGRMDGARGSHIVFCLDDSGSMMNSWPEVLEAFKCFLTTRLEKGNIHDIISVIQFDHTARVSLRRTSIREAITASDGFICDRGGTAYYPVLCAADHLMEEEESKGMDVLVVFMTDGDCIDTNEAIGKLVSLCHKYEERNFQFIGVAFITDGTALQSLTAAAATRGKLVMAKDTSELRLCFQDIAREIHASFRT